MTAVARPILDPTPDDAAAVGGDGRIESAAPDGIVRRLRRSGRIVVGGGILLTIVAACVLTLPLTLREKAALHYDNQRPALARQGPAWRPPWQWLGTDALGRSLLGRCLLGGTISLMIGVAAALISVVLGVGVGLLAGYRGGWIDAALMRSVDVLYGLPYVLMVVLFKIGLEPQFANGNWLPGAVLVLALAASLFGTLWLDGQRPTPAARRVGRGRTIVVAVIALVIAGPRLGEVVVQTRKPFALNPTAANLVVLFLSIGLVSWLTMARVVRGQVLSLRSQPFIEACRAAGLPEWRIFTRHLLPNLIGPISVYATLTVPQAILQESFLSFLGIGIQPPVPTWGLLASEGLIPALNPIHHYSYMLIAPCVLLSVTLLSLNFLGDGLRDVFDPKREAAKI